MNKQKKIPVKWQLTAAILLALGSVNANASMFELGNGNNNFTMLDPGGGAVGGTNDVVAKWDGTYNTSVATAVTNMTLSSATTFFGNPWSAHNIEVFAPGTYTFEACPGPIVSNVAADGSLCNSGVSTPQTMVVGKGQTGVHMLFDWNGTVNIDVINVWDKNAIWGFGYGAGETKNNLQTAGTGCALRGRKAQPDSAACQNLLQTKWLFSATDPDGNGVPGSGMVDGPFVGFNATFNLRPQVAVSAVPIPAAAWLMVSGLFGLFGFTRKGNKRG